MLSECAVQYLVIMCSCGLFAGSSSSGRMSMESACSGASLGDSGTHSDPEDRKVN
jgi:hypothetical protein